MIKFLFGVIIGILIFFFFLYFGGGKALKKVGEGLTETGKKMEVMEDVVKKEKDQVMTGLEKGILKKEQETLKKTQ